jgi:hypothetical protein
MPKGVTVTESEHGFKPCCCSTSGRLIQPGVGSQYDTSLLGLVGCQLQYVSYMQLSCKAASGAAAKRARSLALQPHEAISDIVTWCKCWVVP